MRLLREYRGFHWLGVSKALLGKGIALRQQRALEWVEMIRDNPDLFKKELIESEEFQDGFVVALENYLKIRSTLKRAAARKIFQEFTGSFEKLNFQLERYNDALQKISEAGIQFLSFLEQEIGPMKEAAIQAEMRIVDLEASGKSRQWHLNDMRRGRALSQYFEQMMLNEYHPDGLKMREQYGTQDLVPPEKIKQLSEIEAEERRKYDDLLAELDFLGIIKINTINSPGRVGFVDTLWDYTQFGKALVTILMD